LKGVNMKEFNEEYYKEPDNPNKYLTPEEARLLKLKRCFLDISFIPISKELNCDLYDLVKIEQHESTDPQLIMNYKFYLEKQLEFINKNVVVTSYPKKKKFAK